MKKRFLGIALTVLLLGFASFAAAQSTAAGTDTPRSGLFFRVQGGLSLFPAGSLDAPWTFELYGETATILESYSSGAGPMFDVSAGGKFNLGRTRMKAGIGFTSVFHNDSLTITATLPHPLQTNTPRTAELIDPDLENAAPAVYVFGLFSLARGESFELWLGPILGLGFDKFFSPEDFGYTESSATGSKPVIDAPVYLQESITSLWFGAALDLEWRLGGAFSVVASGRLVYDNPKVPNIGKRINWLQAQILAGLQVAF